MILPPWYRQTMPRYVAWRIVGVTLAFDVVLLVALIR